MYTYHLKASFDDELKTISSEENKDTSTIITDIPMRTSVGKLRYGLQRTVDDLRKQNIYPTETG